MLFIPVEYIFTFGNLSNPVNSSIITSQYLNDEENNKGTFTE